MQVPSGEQSSSVVHSDAGPLPTLPHMEGGMGHADSGQQGEVSQHLMGESPMQSATTRHPFVGGGRTSALLQARTAPPPVAPASDGVPAAPPLSAPEPPEPPALSLAAPA